MATINLFTRAMKSTGEYACEIRVWGTLLTEISFLYWFLFEKFKLILTGTYEEYFLLQLCEKFMKAFLKLERSHMKY